MELNYFDEKQPAYGAAKRFFTEFLDREDDDKYRDLCRRMLDTGKSRLVVNLSDLRQFDSERTKAFLANPMEHYAPFCSALKDFMNALPEDASEVRKPTTQEYSLGVEGSFGKLLVSPRELSAQHLGKMICVEGIATRCSLVRPKVQRTVHYCEETNAWTENEYHDSTSLTGFPTSSVYPTQDSEGRRLTTEFGLSSYVDTQTLAMQEMPEKAPPGLLPRYVSVVLNGDLVDSCKPGDRVQVTGIYRAMPKSGNGETSGIFNTVLIANHVRPIGSFKASTSNITEQDIVNIRTVSKRADVVDLIARSIAPSIFGHSFIKRALALLLLGGVEKNLDNGTHIRGDLNLLMVGDPSTAKSQLLRFVLNIAPLAINTTGRGSSGVGLTAAVLQDKDSGERRLEAGAMVLADRGVVCIDEFDKMSEADRVAIHEVMEQQTVTISKAGIHMSLNARCSVVAAANPRYGNYDTSSPAHHNVNLPDSLLSRFDLLFIVLDRPDPAIDRKISDKVLKNHRYVPKRSTLEDDDQKDQEDGETPIFQKFDRHLHSVDDEDEDSREGSNKNKILSVPFMKKYFEFAKASYKPVLSEAASAFIGEEYQNLRRNSASKPLPVTARALETMIRLACAHAKARLSRTVTKQDAVEAMKILNFALDHDTQTVDKRSKKKKGDADKDDSDDESTDDDNDSDKRPKKRRRKKGGSAKKKAMRDESDEDEDEDEDLDELLGSALDSKYTPQSVRDDSIEVRTRRRGSGATTPSTPKSQGTKKRGKASKGSRSSKKKRRALGGDDSDGEEVSQGWSQSQDLGSQLSSAGSFGGDDTMSTQSDVPAARIAQFMKTYSGLMKGDRMEIQFDALLSALNKGLKGKKRFSAKELTDILKIMEDENKLMFRKQTIWRLV